MRVRSTRADKHAVRPGSAGLMQATRHLSHVVWQTWQKWFRRAYKGLDLISILLQLLENQLHQRLQVVA